MRYYAAAQGISRTHRCPFAVLAKVVRDNVACSILGDEHCHGKRKMLRPAGGRVKHQFDGGAYYQF
jgi:hypothetical protein